MPIAARPKFPQTVRGLQIYYMEAKLENTSQRCFCFDPHFVESVCILSCSGPFFAEFGLNTERYGISPRIQYGVSPSIQYKCGKIRTRKTPNMDMDIFHAVPLHL